MSYARVLATYPFLVLGVVLLFALTCMIAVVTVGKWPDFTDPRLGFEARGTEISQRLMSYDQLLKNTKFDRIPPKRQFTSSLPSSAQRQYSNHGNRSSRMRRADSAYAPSLHDTDRDQEHGFFNSSEPEGFFCDIPRAEYARVVFESSAADADASLFTLENILAMCEVEQTTLRALPAFQDICIHRLSARECCRSWSLGNYIARLYNRTECSKITADDVTTTFDLLKTCRPFYNNGTLKPFCSTDSGSGACRTIPTRCKKDNVVYDILHFLTDLDFMTKTSLGFTDRLTYAVTFLPVAAGIGTTEFYKEIEGLDLSHNDVRITAVNFGVKESLFNYHLKKDAVWFAVAFISIFILMWIYTCSLFLTVMTIVSIIICLDISYFLYTIVYQIDFFPFKNLLAIVILLGIGADDVFVYVRVWNLAKHDKNTGTLEKIVSDTLKHATLSMFVTSLTTSAAFFASYVSQITAVCCFAIFAGTVVMVNFIVMVTWIPASVILCEKWCASDDTSCKCIQSGCCCRTPSTCRQQLCSKISEISRKFFEGILPIVIGKARYLWLLLLGSLGVGGIIVIFYYPKLKLPSSNDFQVFAHDHLFEVYDFQVKDHLWFEKSSLNDFAHMPMIVVWGVDAVDNGNKLDPFDTGTIQYNESFNIALPESQNWLKSFCQKIRSLKTYQWEHGLHLTNCFIDSLVMFMKRSCRGFDGENLEPCCGDPEFPYSEQVFMECMREWLPRLQNENPFYFINRNAGLRFAEGRPDNQKPAGVIVQYLSTVPYSMNYNKMKDFYESMNRWTKEQMKTAPTGLQGGWFISDLEFFDVQDTIARGTPIAIGVSIGIAAFVALITTLNIFITLYAVLSIASGIFVTVGSLVLLGWELNILEAVTMSAAVGLSIDFTLHYGVAYVLTPDLERSARVFHAVSSMGSPIAMAALTTFMSGALMMPSTVLAYRQLGTFLMLVMFVSWVYSTLFFLSLLWIIGPQGGFGQLHVPSSDCCPRQRSEHVDKTVYAESAASNNGSETYELDHLYSSSEVTTPVPLTSDAALTSSDASLQSSSSSVIHCNNHRSVTHNNHSDSTINQDSLRLSPAQSESLLHLTLSDTDTLAPPSSTVSGNSVSSQSEIWVKLPLKHS